MKKPDFFIVGAPKCGTTSLEYMLSRHPQIFIPKAFEPTFFSSDFEQVCHYTLETYLQLFAAATDEHLALGEKSPLYLYSQVAIDRILGFNPDARIIVMLRKPSDLIYSWHSHCYFRLIEDVADFESAWELQGERQQGRQIPASCDLPFALQYREIGSLGKYMQQLVAKVPKSQLLAIFMEDMHADVETVYRSTLDFLGVPYAPIAGGRKLNSNKRHRLRWLAQIGAEKATSPASQLYKKTLQLPLVDTLPVQRWINRFNIVQEKRLPLSPEQQFRLANEFRDDVLLLSEVTGRDLSHWLN